MKANFLSAIPYAHDAMNLPVRDIEAALPFYETVMDFKIVPRRDGLPSEAHPRAAILARDNIAIGLAENGGDPEQEGCFFEVNDVEAAFAELQANGLGRDDAGFRIEQRGDAAFKIFFVIAPDGLCYCLGQRQ